MAYVQLLRTYMYLSSTVQCSDDGAPHKMYAAKYEIRAVIHFLRAERLPDVCMRERLTSIYGVKCINVEKVRKLCREFESGRVEIHDEKRNGRSLLWSNFHLIRHTVQQQRSYFISALYCNCIYFASSVVNSSVCFFIYGALSLATKSPVWQLFKNPIESDKFSKICVLCSRNVKNQR